MANKNILTYGAKQVQVELEYYSPVALVQGAPVSTIYAFLGRVDPWPLVGGIEEPEFPQQSQQYLKQTFKDMFVAKKLYSSNFSPVIQRVDWVKNTVYYPYDDKVDMFGRDVNDNLIKPFYVRNRYDQVFKCLSNHNGALSTYEPYFQPGSYGTNNIFQDADLYKWKYMYTISTAAKRDFLDVDWLPVPIGANTPNPYQTSAGWGNIDVINVTNGGNGYDVANSFIAVKVIGDGSVTASGNVTSSQVVNGQIVDVVVGNTGKNYTSANVTITAYTSANQKFVSPLGSGATAVAPVSPVGGHSFDAVSELGCKHVMFSCLFNGSENGVIPTDPQYRQVGLLFNPSAYDTYPDAANNSIYNLTTKFTVSSGQGLYVSGEAVRQLDPLTSAVVFTGKVLSFDSASGVCQVINTTGTTVLGQALYAPGSGTSRTVLQVTPPDLIPFSGHLAYIENRDSIQRSADGIEQFKFILGY